MIKRMLKSLFGTNVALLVFFGLWCVPISVQAQDYSESELDTLVSSIALYPDPLLVQVLTASTYGDQIPAANRFAQNHRNLTGEALATAIEKADMGYDPSVIALIPFPSVLDMMNRYAAWCNQLGEAMLYQKEGVMEAVQRMRQKAYNMGHLQTNEQVKVVVEKEIVIQPARYEYIYVPVYNPGVVYYSPYRGGRVFLSYGSGILVGGYFGEWGWGTSWFDWGYHVMYIRNHDWYYHRRIPHHPRRYVPPHRSYGPPPGHRPGPRPTPSVRVAPAPRPAPAPAPSVRVAPAPRPAPAPAPSVRVAPAPRPAPAPAPSVQVAPAPRPAPAPAPSVQVAPAPRPAPAPAPSVRVAPAPRPAPAPAPSVRVAPAPRPAPAPAPTRRSSSNDDDRRGHNHRR